MDGAFADVLAMSEAKSVDLRGAAMMVAVERGRRHHPARPLPMTDRTRWRQHQERWEAERLKPALERSPERRPRFITQSGVEIDRI